MLTVRTIPKSERGGGGASEPAPVSGNPRAAEVLAEAGRRIRQARRSRGMSIKELAFAAGINPSFLSYIETGRKAPSMETVVHLAEALGMALHRFFRDKGPKRNGGERSLGAFLRVASWSTPREKAFYCEIFHSYAKLARNKPPERRTRMLKVVCALLQALRRARV